VKGVIAYTDDPSDVLPEQLHGFFQGWPDPPTPEAHVRLLRGSSEVVLAVEEYERLKAVEAGAASKAPGGAQSEE